MKRAKGKKVTKGKGLTVETKTESSSPYFKRLTREFFDQDCFEVARSLLGKVLVRKLHTGEIVRGTIVETEAYPGLSDPASHSFNLRRTERNEAMFMEPGTSYVYFTYGMYHCMNVSCKGEGAAILLRGLELHDDYEIVRQLRQSLNKKRKVETETTNKKKPELKLYEIANGPSKLCLSFDIDKKKCDKLDLVTSDLMWVEHHHDSKYNEGNFDIEISTRIGIFKAPEKAKNEPYRYFIADNFSVSTAKPHQIQKKLALLEKEKAEQEQQQDDEYN